MTPCHECNLGHIVGQANQQEARCTPTILSAGPTLALPRLIIVLPSVELLFRAWYFLTRFNHLISDGLTLRLPYYFSCATTPRATLPTMCSVMIMRQKVSDNSIPRMFAKGLSCTKPIVREYVVSETRLFPLIVGLVQCIEKA